MNLLSTGLRKGTQVTEMESVYGQVSGYKMAAVGTNLQPEKRVSPRGVAGSLARTHFSNTADLSTREADEEEASNLLIK